MEKLPVLRIAFEALLEIRRKGAVLIRALFLPTLAMALVDAIDMRIEDSLATRIAFGTVNTVLSTVFAVICHRVVILGGASLPNAWGITWGGRETSFFLWCVLFGIVASIFSNVVGALAVGLLAPLLSAFPYANWVLASVLFVTLAYFSVRIGMVLPATAVDRPAGLMLSWNLTSGQGFRALAAITIPLALPMLAVVVFASIPADQDGLVWNFVAMLLVATFLAVLVVSISAVYRWLTAFPEEDVHVA